MRPGGLWIVSAPFDIAWILAPSFLPLLLLCLVPGLGRTGGELSPWAWLILIVGVDVAHVYATLYRTYLDPEEFARRRFIYLLVPLLCLGAGALLHRADPLWFWRALAYLAVLHFVRQQVGLVRLYTHRQGASRADDLLDRAAVYAATLYPMLWWHLHPRRFEWFVPGDFFYTVSPGLSLAGGWAWGLLLGAFLLRQGWLALKGAWNPGKTAVVLGTAASWYGGIVAFDSDIAFTATNVVAHGVPYIALVWLHWRRGDPGRAAWPRRLPLFLGLLLVLAFLEETVWDIALWREHPMLFGIWPETWKLAGERALSLAVPLLAMPQATHYVLDALIWRFDPKVNPGLRERLLGPA